MNTIPCITCKTPEYCTLQSQCEKALIEDLTIYMQEKEFDILNKKRTAFGDSNGDDDDD